MKKNNIVIMSVLVLLTASCSKEKMLSVELPYTSKPKKLQSINHLESYNEWIDIGPIDKRVAALNVMAMYKMMLNEVLQNRYIHFKISLDENGNYTGGDDFITLKSEDGRWLIHFEEKDFLKENDVQVLKLSCTYDELDDYIDVKIRKHPRYNEYKKLQDSKQNLSKTGKKRLAQLRNEVLFLDTDYDRFGSDILNGLPIILETKDLY